MKQRSGSPGAPPAGYKPAPLGLVLRLPAHVVVPLVVILAVGALLLDAAAEALRPATPVTVAPVVFERQQAGQDAAPADGEQPGQPARRGNGTAVQAAGWLEADPFFIAATALADGVVAEILALEGERVERGDVLARLVDADAKLALARAEADVRAKQAAVRMAEADLAAASSDWDNPVERDRAVASGRASLAETEAELAQLPALIAAEQARLERVQEELNRARQVYAQVASSELEVILLEKSAAAQEATVQSTRRREAILEARRDLQTAELAAAERNARLRIGERRALDAATASLAAAEAALAQAEAARDEAQLRLDRMTITAPITGYLMRRLKSPGDKVILGMDDPHSSHVAHLYDAERIQARVDVPLADAANVFAGQRCEVVVEVLPDETFAGEVTRITHEADVQKNTLQVKVKVINPSPLLRPEMLTRVKFLPDRRAGAGAGGAAANGESVVLVPEAGIDRGGAAPRVWVVRDRRGGRGVVRPADVSIIDEREGWISVRGELRPGDLIAIEPAGLSSGQRVRMQTAREGHS